ncbi:hypothetical protein B0H14DRAFT_317437 [Mycena olivaceomarginata]|nr:hypothetical protein B0H14DRAFT_317437 [Mycena olivaceomarginata]
MYSTAGSAPSPTPHPSHSRRSRRTRTSHHRRRRSKANPRARRLRACPRSRRCTSHDVLGRTTRSGRTLAHRQHPARNRIQPLQTTRASVRAGSHPSHCPPRARPPLTRSASLGVSGACVSPPFLHTANPRAHGPSLKGGYSNEDSPTKADASVGASRTTPTPPRNDSYVAAGVGIANGSYAACMRTGAIRAEEKDERGGHFHRRPTYGSAATARSRMPHHLSFGRA